MIIVNGHIRRKVKSGGGIDATTGFPTAPTSDWGEPIPCQYVPTSQNLQATATGEATAVRHYAIFIEGYDGREGCDYCVKEQILLHDQCCHEIGEYSIISVTPLLAVDQTRIDV
jgi:hypothetical protein